MAVAGKMSVNAAAVAVLTGLDNIFLLRRTAMNASEGFSLWNRLFFFLHSLAVVLKTLWLRNLEFLLAGSTK